MIDWDALYGFIIAATGWGFDRVDRLTLPRLNLLLAHFERHPPMFILMEAFVGFKPKGGSDDGWVECDMDEAEYIRLMEAARALPPPPDEGLN